MFVGSGNQKKLVWLASQNTLQGPLQLLKVIVDRWNDDRDIVGCIRRFGRNGLSLVAPMADGVDDEAEVSMEPVGLILG